MTTLNIAELEADAKTSTGAPCLICSARVADPANEIVTLTPGFADSNLLEISVKVWVRLAAAKTMISVSAVGAMLCVALSALAEHPLSASAIAVSTAIFLASTSFN